MGITLIFVSLQNVTVLDRCSPLLDWVGNLEDPGNSICDIDRTKTDTGGLVENTKALERTALKELGKLLP